MIAHSGVEWGKMWISRLVQNRTSGEVWIAEQPEGSSGGRVIPLSIESHMGPCCGLHPSADSICHHSRTVLWLVPCQPKLVGGEA